MNTSTVAPLVWIVDPHPQREAMLYTIRMLCALMRRPSRIVDRSTVTGGESLIIHYGPVHVSTESKHYTIVPDEHFWQRVESGADVTPEGISEWRGIMFPRWSESGVSRKLESSSSKTCPVDPIAAAFFMVSRIEELRSRDVDEHGRFPAASAWMVRMGLIERPLVHEFAGALLGAVTGDERTPQAQRPWPGGRTCAVAFTHDVDRMRMHGSLWRDFRSGVGGLRYSGGVGAGMRRATSLLRTRVLGKRDPYDTTEDMLAGQERSGIRSTWFWIATRPSIHNADYSPVDPRASSVINTIQERGHEIGLHGSYESGESPDLLGAERKLLESVRHAPVRSTRQHYLRFRADQTWSGQCTAGLTIDSTLGFAGRMGFRADWPYHSNPGISPGESPTTPGKYRW